MANNPYAKYLGGRDPLEVLQSTPRIISDLAQKIGEGGLEKSYAPGKWNGRFILSHLADCEVAFGFRWRQVAYSPGLTVQPFDQDAWAKNYDKLNANWALGAFMNARLWNLEFLKTLPQEVFAHSATHPERGEMTLQNMLEVTAGHDGNHIAQLEMLVNH